LSESEQSRQWGLSPFVRIRTVAGKRGQSPFLQNPRETERAVASRWFVQILAKQDARGEPRNPSAVTSVAEREELAREIAVKANVREPVNAVLKSC
jgi:hypothetical protein